MRRAWSTALVGGLALFIGSVTAASTDGAAPCPKPRDAIELPLRPGGGVLRGDIDGDGRRDRVSIRFAPQTHASCGFMLVVETRKQALAIRVPEWYKPPQDLTVARWPWQEPYLAFVVQLEPRRSQVVVAREHGAATVSIAFYGVTRGKLDLLRFPPPFPQGLSLFGTVGTGDTEVQCERGGPLVLIGRWPTVPNGHRWRFGRTDYRLVGGRFRVAASRMATVPSSQVPALSKRWHVDVAPFTGCIVARGRRL